MTDVFISYSRRDQEFARRLFDALEKQGLNAWIDWDDIPLTANWWREIQRGIEAANTFVFIISPDSVASDVCRDEIQHAIDNHKRFVPILHREIVEDAHKTVMHSAISSHNWLYFREVDAFDTAVKALQNVLSSDLDHIRAHTRLLVRAQEWREKERDGSYLLQGSDLQQAESWLASSAGKAPAPTALQSEYIFASRGRANRRGRLLMAASVVAVLVTAALALFAFGESREAQLQRGIAENSRATSEYNEALALEAAETSVYNEALAVSAAETSVYNEALAVSAAETAQYRANVLDSLQSASDASIALQNNDRARALERAQNANAVAQPPQAQRVLGEVAYAPGFRARLEGHADWLRVSAFSLDGQMLLSGSDDGEVILWDLSAGIHAAAPLYTLNAALAEREESEGETRPQSPVIAAGFTADGTQAIVVEGGGWLVVWDIATGEEVNRIARGQRGEAVAAAAISTDGAVAAFALPDGTIVLFQIADNVEIGRIEGLEGRVAVLAFSADGRRLAAGTQTGMVSAWDTQTLEVVGRFDTDGTPIGGVSFDSTGTWLVAGRGDGGVTVWDLMSGRTIREFTTAPEFIRAVSISHDRRRVLAASCVNGLTAWEMATGEPIPLYEGEVATVGAVSFSLDGQLAAFGNCPGGILPSRGNKGDLILWSVNNGAVERELRNSFGSIVAAAYALDGSAFSMSSEGYVVHWDTTNGAILKEWVIEAGPPTSFALSADGGRFLAGSADGTLTLINSTSDDEPLIWRGHTGRINAVALSPDGQIAASAGGDHRVLLWDTASGGQLRGLGESSPDLTTWPFTVLFTNDGTQIITATTQGRIAVWETATGALVSHYDAVEANFYLQDAALSLDSQTLALVGNQPAAYLSEVESGTTFSTLPTTASQLYSTAFTPGGDRLLLGSAEGVITVWDMAERLPVRTLYTQSNSPITALAVNPAGTQLISGQQNGYFTIWRLDSPAELVAWTERNRTVTEEVNRLAGDWYDVYFNAVMPDPEASESGILEQAMMFAIQQASRSIEAGFFEINSPAITEALLAAHAEGVEIRLIVDDEFTFEDEDSTIAQLQAAGIPIVGDGRSALMHHTFMVLDGSYLWLSSAPPTTNAFNRNNNDAVLIQAQPLAAIFMEEFNRLFESGEFGARGLQGQRNEDGLTSNAPVVVDNAEFEVYLMPNDRDIIEARLIELVKSAKTSVRFAVFNFTLDGLADAMIDHLRSGVVVEGVFETTGSSTQFSAMNALACAHARVRQDGNRYILHHKVIIIDDHTVVMGTFNYSQNAIENNNEALLVIHSREIARTYHDEWRKIYEAASPPDMEALDCESMAEGS